MIVMHVQLDGHRRWESLICTCDPMSDCYGTVTSLLVHMWTKLFLMCVYGHSTDDVRLDLALNLQRCKCGMYCMETKYIKCSCQAPQSTMRKNEKQQ